MARSAALTSTLMKLLVAASSPAFRSPILCRRIVAAENVSSIRHNLPVVSRSFADFSRSYSRGRGSIKSEDEDDEDFDEDDEEFDDEDFDTEDVDGEEDFEDDSDNNNSEESD